MKNKTIENKHAIYCQDVSDIALPLQNINVSYFHHVRSYINGSRISLSNNQPWMLHYYSRQYYLQPAINKKIDNERNYQIILPNTENKIFFDLYKNFQISNCLIILEACNTYTDTFYFGTSPENYKITEFYINNLHIFKRFILYFRDRGSSLIKQANSDPIIFPLQFEKLLMEEKKSNENSHSIDSIKNFLNQTPVNKYYLVGQEKLHFTQKDIDTLKLCLEGSTSKEIAKVLGVSYRTVETRLEDIKIKLGCRNKIEIIKNLYSIINI